MRESAVQLERSVFQLPEGGTIWGGGRKEPLHTCGAGPAEDSHRRSLLPRHSEQSGKNWIPRELPAMLDIRSRERYNRMFGMPIYLPEAGSFYLAVRGLYMPRLVG